MNTVVFRAFSSVGASLGTASVTGVVEYGTDFYDRALNQSIIYTADAGSIVYGNSMKRSEGIIIIKAVSHAEGILFKTWLRDTLQFRANYAGIEIASAPIDLGKGDGTNIAFVDEARYIHSQGDKASRIEAPLVHTIKFEYSFKR